MKKTSFLIAAIALLSFNIYAQKDASIFNFGIKAGGNYSNIYDSQDSQFKADEKVRNGLWRLFVSLFWKLSGCSTRSIILRKRL